MGTCWSNFARGEALQGVARRGVSIDGRGSCEHRCPHGFWLPESGWDSAQHQPFEKCCAW